MLSRGFIIFRCGEFLTVLTFLVKKSTMRLSRVCVYVYVCMCVCMCVCMYVCIFFIFYFFESTRKKTVKLNLFVVFDESERSLVTGQYYRN